MQDLDLCEVCGAPEFECNDHPHYHDVPDDYVPGPPPPEGTFQRAMRDLFLAGMRDVIERPLLLLR